MQGTGNRWGRQAGTHHGALDDGVVVWRNLGRHRLGENLQASMGGETLILRLAAGAPGQHTRGTLPH